MKPIRNYNKKGQFHRYNERYYNDKITMRGNFINDKMIGYTEHHWSKITRFNII
jgi:hypothetical protein